MKLFNFIIFVNFLLVSCANHLPDFTSELSYRSPIKSDAESIGEFSLGCLKGAQTFKGDEVGLVLTHKNRGRYFAHPSLIEMLTIAGKDFYKKNKVLMLGDLSLSRGGPMLKGHNSHQTGLDVDIWFKLPAANYKFSFSELELNEMRPIEKITKDEIALVKYFLQQEKVDRIFINPIFKKQFCANDEFLQLKIEEQQKLRAWWGHDDHIHVRLKCPSDSPNCIPQAPQPKGNGCGDELNWWFSDEANKLNSDTTWSELKTIYLDKIKKLPKACGFYLN